jgi:hypothetical protein
MTTVLACLAIAHGAAFIGLLAAARYSHLLVDDHGRPLTGTWHEATIPVVASAEASR